MNKKLLYISLVLIKITIVFLLLFYTEHYDIPGRSKQLFLLFGYIGVLAFYTIWISSIISILMIAFFPNTYFKVFFITILFVSTILGASYTKISGSSLLYDNLYTLLENAGFAGNAISQYKNELLYATALASLSFILLIPSPFKITASKKYFYSVSHIVVLFPIIIIFILAFLRGGNGVRETPMQYRIISLISVVEITKYLYIEKDYHSEVSFHPKNKDFVNIVLIIEESLRGDYLDINRDRGITPYIASNKKRIINFGIASSGANCSADSNQILRFGPNINNFEFTFKTNPYIWDYAKKAGYQTVMIEGQAAEGFLNNRMSKKEILYIDKFIYSKGKNRIEKDMDLASKIKISIDNATKPLFLIAVKSGIHFPYEEEGCSNNVYISHDFSYKENIVKSYMNAIYCMIDPFFKSIIDGRIYKNTILIYTSDHGQNLFDNGYKTTHCSATNISPYEGVVPLFIITENSIFREKFTKALLMNYDKASHFNIYPTILEILGYDKKYIGKLHGTSLFDMISEKRKFTSMLVSVNKNGVFDSIKWNQLPDDILSGK